MEHRERGGTVRFSNFMAATFQITHITETSIYIKMRPRFHMKMENTEYISKVLIVNSWYSF